MPKKSFGLGLYIVHNILIAHKLKLIYKYNNGINNFIFSDINLNQGKNIDK